MPDIEKKNIDPSKTGRRGGNIFSKSQSIRGGGYKGIFFSFTPVIQGPLFEAQAGEDFMMVLKDSTGLSNLIIFTKDGVVQVDGSIYPTSDNDRALGSTIRRFADVQSVLINGADIGFANGWKFREYPLDKKDVSKPVKWMKKNANLGVQLLDDKDNVIAVFHKDGNIYTNNIRPLSDLIKP